MLTEMDGFEGNSGVIVLGATNIPEVLDKALLRPGRFDRQIRVGLPDLKGREKILGVHTKDKPLDDDVSLKDVARRCLGMSGAELMSSLDLVSEPTVRRNENTLDSDLARKCDSAETAAEADPHPHARQ